MKNPGIFFEISLTVTLDTVLIEGKALIASTAVTADRVFASAVQTHSRKFDALVNVLTLSETVSSWAQFRVGWRARLGAQLTLLAAPSTTHGATTEAFGEMALYGIDALAVAVIQEAGFLPSVNTSGV